MRAEAGARREASPRPHAPCRFRQLPFTPPSRSEAMQQPNREAVGDVDAAVPPGVAPEPNGQPAANGGVDAAMYDFLRALQAMRGGRFPVPEARRQVGLAGQNADSLNEIVAANQRMAQQLER